MTQEQEFFIYLLEYYAAYRDMPTSKVLAELEALDLVDFICNDMYWRYSTETIENAFEDIDILIAEKKSKKVAKEKVRPDISQKYARRFFDSLSEEQLLDFVRIFGDENTFTKPESDIMANTSATPKFQNIDALFSELETE